MTREEAIKRLHQITQGITLCDGSDDAWWETSTGAEFGACALNELEKLIEELMRPD